MHSYIYSCSEHIPPFSCLWSGPPVWWTFMEAGESASLAHFWMINHVGLIVQIVLGYSADFDQQEKIVSIIITCGSLHIKCDIFWNYGSPGLKYWYEYVQVFIFSHSALVKCLPLTWWWSLQDGTLQSIKISMIPSTLLKTNCCPKAMDFADVKSTT